ncbi:type II toxin-antitoxin system RelE/ParE family toxin [Planctomycetota bacterium]
MNSFLAFDHSRLKRYLVFYRIDTDTIEIVRILSGYRDIDTFL